jgi:carboxylesterase type B
MNRTNGPGPVVEGSVVQLDAAKRKRPRIESLSKLCCALLAAAPLATCVSSAEGREPPPIVRTQDGWLQGTRSGGVERFLAVPYAAPPVGALRWKPPASAPRWRGIRAADTLPPHCPQLGGGGDEDCLYLNVFRPAHPQRSGPLPVLFYIHGGSMKVGSASDNDPSRIAGTTDTIVVMINYRLGQFGFLAHPALGAEAGDGTSGEYGLMDQQAALRWVHQRIAAFGGDPRNVTIAGGSAGGLSVCAHLASPAAAGLFSQAIIQSAGCFAVTRQAAEAEGLTFAATAGCPSTESASCLRSKSTAELLASDSWAHPSFFPWGARLLPEEPASAVTGGRFNRVPVMLGGTSNEVRSGLAGEYPISEQTYLNFVNGTFGEQAQAVLDVYPLSAYSEPFDAMADVLDDSGVGGGGSCETRQIALAMSTFVPTYFYDFADFTAPTPTWVAAPPGFELGASHGSDEVYWFDRPMDTVEPLDGLQRWLADQMIQYLGAFAERGAPRARHQTNWPRFEQRHERVLSFRPGEVTVRTDFEAENHCEFWTSIGF